MTFAAPLSWIAGGVAVGGAAIAALYVLKLRRRRVTVPFARLWARVLAERDSAAPLRRLKRLLSLLLQLLLFTLLVAAAGDPRPSRESGGGRTIALLIDASASMQATDGAPTRFAAALDEARRIAERLGPGDAAVVVRLDAQPAPMGGLVTDENALRRQIDALAAEGAADAAGDLAAALHLAADLVRAQPRPEIALLSDGANAQPVLDRAAAGELGALDLRGITLSHLPIGEGASRGDNVAIVGFAARRYPQSRSSYEVFVALRSYLDRPSETKLELLQDGEVVDVQRVALGPGEQVDRLWPDLAGAGARLEARLTVDGGGGGGDALPLDDHAFALLPPLAKQRVLLVSAGDLFLEGALLLDENARVETIAPGAWDPALAARYDAVVLDGFTPPDPPPRPTLYIDPRWPPGAGPFPIAGQLAAPLITDVAERHPLMRWVALRDVNMTRASRFQLQPGDVALASSGRDALIVAHERPLRAMAIGFDVRRSDLPLRVAFPVLLVNALEWFAGGALAADATIRTGHPTRIAAPGDEAELWRDGTSERARLPIVDGHATVIARRAGFYTLAAGRSPRPLAASLTDPEESRIAPARDLRFAGAPLPRPSDGSGIAGGRRRAPPWVLLALAALLLLVVEWWSYNRRVTV